MNTLEATALVIAGLVVGTFLFGWAGFLILLLLAILALGLWLRSQKPAGKAIEREKEKLKQEISEAEKMLLKNKIDEKAFREISEKNNAKLIELQAKGAETTFGLGLESLGLASKDKHRLKQALKRKAELERQLKLAERNFLKRKIDEKTYKPIVGSVKKELISVNADAALIYKERAKEIARESILKVKNQALKERIEKRRQANDITEQIEEESKSGKETKKK